MNVIIRSTMLTNTSDILFKGQNIWPNRRPLLEGFVYQKTVFSELVIVEKNIKWTFVKKKLFMNNLANFSVYRGKNILDKNVIILYYSMLIILCKR